MKINRRSRRQRCHHRANECRRRQTTPASARSALVDVEAETARRGSVGVGIPGAVSPSTGLVKNANSTWLIGKPLLTDLEARLARPIRVMNDANCFAISEAADGAGAGAEVVFGVILGTGVGGGIVVRGRAIDGPNLIAGEWGHVPLPWMTSGEFPGPVCYCGKRGCIEPFLGPASSRISRGHRPPGRAARRRRRRGGVTDAALAMARYHDRPARLDGDQHPRSDVIVLGGTSNPPRLAESVGTVAGRHVF